MFLCFVWVLFVFVGCVRAGEREHTAGQKKKRERKKKEREPSEFIIHILIRPPGQKRVADPAARRAAARERESGEQGGRRARFNHPATEKG